MKEMKRVLSLVLCFVMLVGCLPMGALAAETEDIQPVVEAVLGEGVSTWKPVEEPATEAPTEETEATEEIPAETARLEEAVEDQEEESSAQATVSEEDVAAALAEAEAYIAGLMEANAPKSIVESDSKFFTWDYEKRKSPTKAYLYEWSYYNGVVFEGIDNLYDVTGEADYADYVESYLDAMITDGALNSYAGYVDYHGADCYKTASLLLDCYALTGNEEYKSVAGALYTDLQNAKAKYTSDDIGGNFYHGWKSIPTYHLWLDGLYMILPFMAEYAAAYDEAELQLIADRLAWVSENMYDSETGLFSHAIDLEKQAYNNNGQFWGRAIGWYAAALVDVMDHMPAETQKEMAAQLKKLVDGMLPYQTEDGMWRQFVNVESSVKETSVTALVGYAIMKAVNEGWLEDTYAQYAEKAFVGICSYALDDSGLHYICHKGSTTSYSSVTYGDYVDEGKGVGPFIMLCAEVEESVYGITEPEETPKTVSYITINEGNGAAYKQGDTLLFQILVTYSDGTEAKFTQADCTYTIANALTGEAVALDAAMTTVGEYSATITYEGVECGTKLYFTVSEAEDFGGGSTSFDTLSLVIEGVKLTGDVKEMTEDETVKAAMATVEGVTNFLAYDISAEQPAEGETATVSVPVPEDWGTDNLKAYYINDAGEVAETIEGTYADGKFTFEVTHFSTYVVAEGKLSGDPTITEGVTAVVSGSYYRFYNTSARKYLGGTITNNRLNLTTTGNVYWYVTQEGSNFYVQLSGPTGQYLTMPNTDNVVLSNTKTALSLGYVTNVGAWNIQQGGQYLNNYNAAGNYASGWTSGAANDTGSRWRFDRVVLGSGADVKLLVTPDTLAMHPNDVTAMQAVVQLKVDGEYVDQDLSKCSITWSVADADVAEIAANGTLSAKAAGSTTVTATLNSVDGVALATPISVNIPLTVTELGVDKIELLNQTGTVNVGASGEANTHAKIRTTYTDGTFIEEYVTLDMLSGKTIDTSEVGQITGLTVNYNGTKFTGFTLNVVEKGDVNYPDFPNPGSVMLDKYVADATQFQDTGVAEINLVAAGLPAHVGVDVILVTDLSNSMARPVGGENDDSCPSDFTLTKLYDLQQSVGVFADGFLLNDDGTANDNTVSIVTFGGYDEDYTNKSYASQYADVTRTHLLGENSAAAVKQSINNIILLRDSSYGGGFKLSFDGGRTYNGNYGNTNYDYAFMETRKAVNDLKAKYEAENGESYEESGRTIHVIFMTDGAPTNYNGEYYNYKTGDRPDVNARWIDENGNRVAYNMGDNGAQYTQQNWYNLISGNRLYWAGQVYNMPAVESMFCIGFDLAHGGFASWIFTTASRFPLKPVLTNIVEGVTLQGYDAEDSEALEAAYAELAAQLKLAAQDAYYIDEMGGSFDLQRAHTVEKFTKTNDGVDSEIIPLEPEPQITVSTQEIYTADDVGKTVGGAYVTDTMVGKPYGDKTVQEIVTFSEDGSQAYSDQSYSYRYLDANGDIQTAEPTAGTNILRSDGVIYGKTFWYNTTSEDKTIVLADGSTETLTAESFRWNIGTITNEQFVMSYYVYLEGAAEGNAEPGTYATNKKATLYYENWLGNDADQSVDSPNLAWESASVWYRFYLVDENGNPVTDRATGETGPIEKAVTVTDRIKYDEILLNTVTNEKPGTIILANDQVLPQGYVLYDNQASYTVVINSKPEESYWMTTYDTSKTNAVYVTDYHGGDFSNDTNTQEDRTSTDGWDLTSTTAYFPVLWIPATVPDVVVIDYGLPVQIGVLLNDVFGVNAKLNGIGQMNQKPATVTEGNHFTFSSANLGSELDLTYGTAHIDNTISEVVYTPDTMQMNSKDKFIYEAQFNHPTEGTTYYYGDVTVIPATTIYYEDTYTDVTGESEYSFLTLKSFARPDQAEFYRGFTQAVDKDGNALKNVDARGYLVDKNGERVEPNTKHPDYAKTVTVNYAVDLWNDKIENVDKYGYEVDENGNYLEAEDSLWSLEGDTKHGYQAEDRPGRVSLSTYDANNIYGFDQVHESMSQHSMGSAQVATVDANSYAVAEFDFYGTGFDVISMTSNATGTLVVEAYPYENDAVSATATRSVAVDTYYGYTTELRDVTYVYAKVGEETDENNEVQPVYGWKRVSVSEEASSAEKPGQLPADGNVGESVTIAERVWIQDNSTDNALYQVPVMKIEDLPYGRYRGVITASYFDTLDHTGAGEYQLFLDAIRIYDPAGTTYDTTDAEGNKVEGNIDDEIQAAYKADNEAWPMYMEVRNLIIGDSKTLQESFKFDPTAKTSGAIFIDQQEAEYTIGEYISYGPNNEMYLAEGQAVAFELDLSGFTRKLEDDKVFAQVADVQIGLKSAGGTPVAVKMGKWTKNSDGTYSESSSTAVLGAGTGSSTDRYYSIASHVNKTGTTLLSFQNTTESDSILSITNIKVTFVEKPNDAVQIEEVVNIDGQQASAVLKSFNKAATVVKQPEPLPEAELEVNTRNTSVKVGSSVVLKVTTSADVDYLTVNGETVTKFSQNQQTGKRSWTATVKAETAGELDIVVDACSIGHGKLDTETLSVEVTEKTAGVAQSVIDSIISRLFR